MVSSRLRGVLGIVIDASCAIVELASLDFSSSDVILMTGGRDFDPCEVYMYVETRTIAVPTTNF